ncbi:MAG: DUF559 domain-containing protein, partial [Bacteroidales bacterium]|nr:DUF559 domain-containing protein [Bacteroidales bacterium]
ILQTSIHYKWQKADPLEYEVIKGNATRHRKCLTETENAFWQIAKGCGLGEKCRRQYIIGKYIVDFFFRESKLVVEIDGEYHFSKGQQYEDAIRQKWLEDLGYKVLRLTNEQILFDTENSIKTIKQYLSHE